MTTASPFTPDQARVLREAVDRVARTGAQSLEYGWHPLLDDQGNPVEGAPWFLYRWWARAIFNGARVTAEDAITPIDAIDQLAELLNRSAQCAHCGQSIEWGKPKNRRLKRRSSGCRWRKLDGRWVPGCGLGRA